VSYKSLFIAFLLHATVCDTQSVNQSTCLTVLGDCSLQLIKRLLTASIIVAWWCRFR